MRVNCCTAHTPGNDAPVAHRYMTRHLRVVAHDAVVADDAVVRNVAIRHDEAVAAHFGNAFFHRAAMYGYKFADGGIVADFNSGFFAHKLQILRYGHQYGTRKYAAVFPDAGAFHNGDVAANPRTFSYFHVFVNDSKRVNFYVSGKLGIRMNIRVRMNHEYVCAAEK